jgi:protein TonB
MTAYAVHRKDSILPAYLAAVALHLAVFLIFTLWLKPTTMLPIGSAVPINIVSKDTLSNSRPAEQAPEPQTAAVETPAPEAPPTPVAPPTPPKAAPTPAKAAPTPTVPAAKPTPAKPAPAAKSSFSLDALEASIAKAARQQPTKPARAAQGPTRAELDRLFRAPLGEGVSQSQLQGLQELLGRLWNPNCQVEGGDEVKLKVTFTVGPDGRLVGRPDAGVADNSANPVVSAAALRAKDAVHQIEPFGEPFRNQKFLVNFNAHDVCASH